VSQRKCAGSSRAIRGDRSAMGAAVVAHGRRSVWRRELVGKALSLAMLDWMRGYYAILDLPAAPRGRARDRAGRPTPSTRSPRRAPPSCSLARHCCLQLRAEIGGDGVARDAARC